MTSKVYLHELRRNRDLALGEVARGIGIKASELSRIERGMVVLTDDVCAKLAAYLGIAEEEIRSGIPSAEEVEADNGRMMDSLTAMSAAQADAKSMGFGKGHGGLGNFPCPICQRGQLHYSVASVNGHLWGRCTTDGCVAWMQ